LINFNFVLTTEKHKSKTIIILFTEIKHMRG